MGNDEIVERWSKTPLCDGVPEPFKTILSYNLEDLGSNASLNNTIKGIPVTMPLTTRLAAILKFATLQKGLRYLSDDIFKLIASLKFDDLKMLIKPMMLKTKFNELSKLFSEGKITIVELLSEPEKLFNEEDAEYFSVNVTFAVSNYITKHLEGYHLSNAVEEAKKIMEKADGDALRIAKDMEITDGNFTDENEKKACIHWTKSMLYLNTYMANMENKRIMDDMSEYGVLTYEPDLIRHILDAKINDGNFSEVMQLLTDLTWDEVKENNVVNIEENHELQSAIEKGRLPWQCAEQLGYFDTEDGFLSDFDKVLVYVVEKYKEEKGKTL